MEEHPPQVRAAQQKPTSRRAQLETLLGEDILKRLEKGRARGLRIGFALVPTFSIGATYYALEFFGMKNEPYNGYYPTLGLIGFYSLIGGLALGETLGVTYMRKKIKKEFPEKAEYVDEWSKKRITEY